MPVSTTCCLDTLGNGFWLVDKNNLDDRLQPTWIVCQIATEYLFLLRGPSSIFFSFQDIISIWNIDSQCTESLSSFGWSHLASDRIGCCIHYWESLHQRWTLTGTWMRSWNYCTRKLLHDWNNPLESQRQRTIYDMETQVYRVHQYNYDLLWLWNSTSDDIQWMCEGVIPKVGRELNTVDEGTKVPYMVQVG